MTGNKTPAFSLRIFMPYGEPEGTKIIEKSNWTGQCVFFPRTYSEGAQSREELKRAGVYILWNLGEYGDLPYVYIGESDQIAARLKSHESQKDFWTRAVVCVSKDQNLNSAHARYLEARLIGLAKEAKRCQLDNKNTPQTPALSEADAADAELYLSDLLLCLPIVGVNFFDRTLGEANPDELLYITSGDLSARGYEKVGEFVVLKDSQVNNSEAPSTPKNCKFLRNHLREEGILARAEGEKYFTMNENCVFGSPSEAAGVVLGTAVNGRTAWKNSEGKTLKDLETSLA